MADTTDADLREFAHQRYRITDEKLDRVLAELQTIGRRLPSIEGRITQGENRRARFWNAARPRRRAAITTQSGRARLALTWRELRKLEPKRVPGVTF